MPRKVIVQKYEVKGAVAQEMKAPFDGRDGSDHKLDIFIRLQQMPSDPRYVGKA